MLGSASIELEFAGEGAGPAMRVLVSGDIGPDSGGLQPDPTGPGDGAGVWAVPVVHRDPDALLQRQQCKADAQGAQTGQNGSTVAYAIREPSPSYRRQVAQRLPVSGSLRRSSI